MALLLLWNMKLPGDNGPFSFAITLTDGTNTTPISNAQPPNGTAADTTAPDLNSTAPNLNGISLDE